MENIYTIEFKDKSGQIRTLKEYEGKVILIVNTASKCGFAPQFTGLEKLYTKYKDQGLVVIGFPCDQFKKQEFATADEAGEFCKINYGVTFEIMDKIDVNGKNESKLFTHLKNEKKGFLNYSAIKWNFTKFVIDQEGNVVKRFAPNYRPEKIDPLIKRLTSN